MRIKSLAVFASLPILTMIEAGSKDGLHVLLRGGSERASNPMPNYPNPLAQLQAIRVDILIRLRVIELRIGSRNRVSSRTSIPVTIALPGQEQDELAAGDRGLTGRGSRSGRSK